MINDKRRSTRRGVRYTAWLGFDDGTLQGCVLSDISDTGARLEVENPDSLPDSFTLLLSRRGTPKRKCKVVWREEKTIGVDFDRKLEAAERTKATRAVMAPSIAPAAEAAEQTAAAEPAEPGENA